MHDLHRVALGVEVGAGGWGQRLEQNKKEFAEEFVRRDEFLTRYPEVMGASEFVDEMYEYARVNPSATERRAAIDAFGAGDSQEYRGRFGRP